MPFKIAQTPTFRAKVEVLTANDKGGVDKSTFWADFYRADVDELAELRKLTPKELLEKKLASWSDLLDENNQPVDFNEVNRQIVVKIPEALLGLTEAFWKNAVIAREKN